MGVDGFDVNLEGLEQTRTEVAGLVGPMASAADGLPAGVSAGAFGGLDGAGALADAVNGLVETAGGEIGTASARLEQVAAAVEAVIDTVRGTDKNHACVMAPA
jgi:high-affinity Fe2+/Pb2+ permease